MTTTETTFERAAGTQALLDAVSLAVWAPSIHNTQPWRWRLADGWLDLFLERSRLLAVADPAAHLAVLSCGAALHHARISLAAAGWRAVVTRLDEGSGPDHLARLRLDRRADAVAAAQRLVDVVPDRHTDRLTTPGPPLDGHRLRSVATAVEQEGARLQILRPNQVYELARAADQAHDIEAHDAWQAELAHLMGPDRPAGIGIPDEAVSHGAGWAAHHGAGWAAHPGRHFCRDGATLITECHHHAATFAILHGVGDSRSERLRAGEALSAGWLTATEHEVAVLPLSAMIEIGTTREALRGMLTGHDHPYLVLRFSALDPDAGPQQLTPRLNVREILETPPRD